MALPRSVGMIGMEEAAPRRRARTPTRRSRSASSRWRPSPLRWKRRRRSSGLPCPLDGAGPRARRYSRSSVPAPAPAPAPPSPDATLPVDSPLVAPLLRGRAAAPGPGRDRLPTRGSRTTTSCTPARRKTRIDVPLDAVEVVEEAPAAEPMSAGQFADELMGLVDSVFQEFPGAAPAPAAATAPGSTPPGGKPDRGEPPLPRLLRGRDGGGDPGPEAPDLRARPGDPARGPAGSEPLHPHLGPGARVPEGRGHRQAEPAWGT